MANTAQLMFNCGTMSPKQAVLGQALDNLTGSSRGRRQARVRRSPRAAAFVGNLATQNEHHPGVHHGRRVLGQAQGDGDGFLRSLADARRVSGVLEA